MKLLIIGGNGMAGHVLIRYFKRQHPEMDVMYTTRTEEGNGVYRLDAADSEAVASLVSALQPDVIVNAAGILNQDAEQHPLAAYRVNGFLPHWLRHLADTTGGGTMRVIHISSDCVFSGARGSYTEQDAPEGTSVYAKSKALGEGPNSRHLTIRTSIIGPEIRQHGIGLLKWFMEQQGTVNGYSRVWWNGVTTLELAKAVDYAIAHPEIGGLVNLTAAETVSKLELLRLFQAAFNKQDVTIAADPKPFLDRTLVATRTDWGYQPPGYVPMLEELAQWMNEA
ncbi:dTDP-4-dehydrorhamnose reductase family protein [Paenibacillus silvisoli]|uniref:dTDP-4-dehydrorhamnose reductase family protein n=1 Tax=Paenibacillus silvisoli TaxID=3110539 RepID=UPI0028049B34|nr:SDR family oxidoreductase [Paenibacillus silvisoli]